MSSGFWWLFDLIVIALGIYVVVSNAKRGMTKVLILCIGYIVTTVVASLLSAVAAPTLYESIAYRTNIDGIEAADRHMDYVKVFTEAIEKKQYGFKLDSSKVKMYLTDEDNFNFDSNLYHYANRMSGTPVSGKSEFLLVLRTAFIEAYGKQLGDRLPEYVRMNFEKQVNENPDIMREYIANYYDPYLSNFQRADASERAFAKEPTTEVLQIFIYFILFSVIMVIIAIFSALAQNKMWFNIQKKTDHVVGGIFGLLEAGVMIILFTLLVRLIVMLGGGEFLCFNEKTIAESKIFSFFYTNISQLI